MTNSERFDQVAKVIDFIIDRLGEERIASEVDEPIDLATRSFCFNVKVSISHSVFNRIIAEFVRHVYKRGIRLPREVSGQEALGEAVDLLRCYYRGVYTKDYDGALLDAASSDAEGLELVLSKLAEAIKTAERKKYIECVLVYQVDQLDWQARYRIVEMYLKQNKECLSSELLDLDPAQLVDHLPELIISHVSTDRVIRQILGFHE